MRFLSDIFAALTLGILFPASNLFAGYTNGQEQVFSASELEILTRYHDLALFGTEELTTIYTVAPDGMATEVPGASSMGAHGGYTDPTQQLDTASRQTSVSQITVIHQHPIQTGYSGTYQGLTDAYAGKEQWRPEIQEQIRTEQERLISDIRTHKLLSAWPPSTTDIITAVAMKKYNCKAVDANGIWSFGLDSNSPEGQKLLQRGEFNDVLYSRLESAGYHKADANRMLEQYRENEKNSVNNPVGIRYFMKVYHETYNETFEYILADLTEALRTDYTRLQIAVAKPVKSRTEWRKAIAAYISFCSSIGLSVSYTEF